MAQAQQVGLAGRRVQHAQRGRLADRVAQYIFFICSILIVLIILSVFVFIGIQGARFFTDAPQASSIFTSIRWDPSGIYGDPSFGSLGLILGSAVTTLLAVLISMPLAFGMALFMTEVTPRWLENILRPLLEIFTGMPSVVIGFLGLVTLVPFVARVVGPFTPNPATAGFGWGTATIVLVIMILPTMISVSIDALRAVPGSVREASLALGSTRWQMMKDAVVPAATTGLATAVILAMARAIGEALAVSMVLKGTTIPDKLFSLLAFFQPNVNVTQFIVLNFSEATGVEREAYFMLAFLLLVVSFLFICISRYIASRSVYK